MTNPSNDFPEFGSPEFASIMLERATLSLKFAEEIRQRYEAGDRDFRGVDLCGVKTLQNINLSGADLSQANLSSVDLKAANLSGANLEGADLSNAELNQANLSGANLTGCVLRYASLMRANLTNVILTNADLTDANFSGCINPDRTSDPAYDRVINAIGHLKRSAWKPITKEGDGDLKSSKFAGKPWLGAGEEWPNCPTCGTPMRFFFQLNLQEIPTKLGKKFGSGILQLFYCTNQQVVLVRELPTDSTFISFEQPLGETVCYFENKGCECCGSEAFSPCQLVRIVQPDGVPAEFEIPQTRESMSMLSEGEFPPKRIVGWQEIEDYPDSEEIENQGISITSDDLDFCYEIGIYPQEGDKLAGWAGWVQLAEYPDCPICHEKMEQLIFELDSDDNIPFLWGDVGIGYILQCRNHKQEVAFLWQCS